MKGIIRAPDIEERARNPCSQRRIRSPRGAFFFLLSFLFLLGAEEAEERAAFSFSFSSSFLLSSSSNVFILQQCSRRNWTVVPSMVSTPAIDGTQEEASGQPRTRP